jgi:hypothetical protein
LITRAVRLQRPIVRINAVELGRSLLLFAITLQVRSRKSRKRSTFASSLFACANRRGRSRYNSCNS